jgi:hypothetical protein
VVGAQNEHSFTPVNARHEEPIGLAGFSAQDDVHTYTIGSVVRTLNELYAQYLFTLSPVVAIKEGMPRGRPLKGEEVRGRLTLRLPRDLIAGIKRAAKRQRLSQADFVDGTIRPILIAQGFI